MREFLHHYWPFSTNNPLLIFAVTFVPINAICQIPAWFLRRKFKREMRQLIYAKRFGKVSVLMRGDGATLYGPDGPQS